MNYRLVIRWQRTCEVNTVPFNDADGAWSLIHCLKCAMENGARLAYEIQQRSFFRGIETIDYCGDVGQRKNANWD